MPVTLHLSFGGSGGKWGVLSMKGDSWNFRRLSRTFFPKTRYHGIQHARNCLKISAHTHWDTPSAAPFSSPSQVCQAGLPGRPGCQPSDGRKRLLMAQRGHAGRAGRHPSQWATTLMDAEYRVAVRRPVRPPGLTSAIRAAQQVAAEDTLSLLCKVRGLRTRRTSSRLRCSQAGHIWHVRHASTSYATCSFIAATTAPHRSSADETAGSGCGKSSRTILPPRRPTPQPPWGSRFVGGAWPHTACFPPSLPFQAPKNIYRDHILCLNRAVS